MTVTYQAMEVMEDIEFRNLNTVILSSSEVIAKDCMGLVWKSSRLLFRNAGDSDCCMHTYHSVV
jgi:hypothetical protein